MNDRRNISNSFANTGRDTHLNPPAWPDRRAGGSAAAPHVRSLRVSPTSTASDTLTLLRCMSLFMAHLCRADRLRSCPLYRPVHVKTLRSQKLRMLLTHRKLLQSKAIAVDNDLRGTLRNFGLKVGMVGTAKFEARIKELVENLPDLAVLVEPLLIVRRVLREQIGVLHRRLLAIVRDDDVCRRLMTVPGVGPVVALTYRATVDVPARFKNSKAVGAVFGLTPSRHQSGESDRPGSVSRCGDEMMRMMLYEAAQTMLVVSTKWSWLKGWAMKIARHRGMKKAIVALARRLAVIMHRIWVDGTEFQWTREVTAA